MLSRFSSRLRSTLVAGAIAWIAAPQDAAAAEPTRLELAREAAAALYAVGGEQDSLRSRVAVALFTEGVCAEASAVLDVGSDPSIFHFHEPAAQRCLDPIARSWASLKPKSGEEAQQLHAAGAYLRRTGRLRQGEDAIGRASVALAAPPSLGDVQTDDLAREIGQLVTRLGGSLPNDLWLARTEEIGIYEGTPLAAARLAYYLSAAQRAEHGLNEAEDLARFAYKARRPDLARAYLDCLPQQLNSGSLTEVRARMFAEHGEVDRAAALLPAIAFSEWHSILWADKGALAARMIDSRAIIAMAAANQLSALAELGTALLLHGDRGRADIAIDHALVILRAGSTAPLDSRKRLAYLLAALGRTVAALDLIARAATEERADVGREVLQGALSGGQTALFDLARARCGCDPDAERSRFGFGPAGWLSSIQRSRRFDLIVALINSSPTIDRADAMGHVIAGLTTPPEWRAARILIDAERDPTTRLRFLVRLGHAMINVGQAKEAAAVSETARALAPARSKDAYDVAWLLHRLGRTTESRAIARTFEPQKKAELLTDIASRSGGF